MRIIMYCTCAVLLMNGVVQANDSDFFVGTWGLSRGAGLTTKSTVDHGQGEKTITKEFSMPTFSGYLQIHKDGTYLIHGTGDKYSGKWKTRENGIVLENVNKEDLIVTRYEQDKAQILVKEPIGTWQYGQRVVDDKKVVQAAETDYKFFYGTWDLVARSRSGVVIPGGKVTIKEDGSYIQEQSGKKVTGQWKKLEDPQKPGGIVLMKAEDGKDAQVTQSSSDNQRISYYVNYLTYAGTRQK